MLDIIIGIFVFLIGLSIGSFANVCIYRIPRKMSIVKPRSQCPACGQPIRPLHNIPLLSYLFLRGKCDYCGAVIGIRYPLVEFICGLLFLFAYYDLYIVSDNIYMLLVGFYLSTVFLIMFFIDVDFQIIPDSLSLSGIVLGVAASFLPGVRLGWLDSVIGLFVGGALFLAVAVMGDKIFKKESMGGGDIKLAAMLGAFLGWQGILLVLVIGSFFGALIGGIMLIMAKDKESAHTIPFGPYLVTAALIVFYRGNELIAAYLKFIGR
ncbi:MAG: prepilin peptidase [candidate division Zixibacteria bacterium]|nr:prepilin peptidase [candidate division Zixibacteria bacterium]